MLVAGRSNLISRVTKISHAASSVGPTHNITAGGGVPLIGFRSLYLPRVHRLKKQFDEAFADFAVHEVHLAKQSHRTLLQNTNMLLSTDQGESLLKHCIGPFDPATQAKEKRAAANEIGSRERAIRALVRGMGRGKTRTLEEIRLAPWQLPNVMCLGIPSEPT